MYWDRGSLELTLELNPIMKPPAAEVAGPMWQHNLPPLMRFMELVSWTRVRCAHTWLLRRLDAGALLDPQVS